MQVLYKDQPKPEDIEVYEHELKNLLDHLGVTGVQFSLYSSPFKIESSVNNQKTRETYYWINSVIVNLNGDELKLESWETGLNGIDEAVTKHELWRIAWQMQNAIYKKFDKNPDHPNNGDPYWLLWDKLPKQTQ